MRRRLPAPAAFRRASRLAWGASGLLLSVLALGCALKRYGPTRIVDPAAFDKGRIQRMAFLGGDTSHLELQDRIVDALAGKYAGATKAGTVSRRESVLAQLGPVRVSAPDPKKVQAQAKVFGDADPRLAGDIRKKIGADAFYVVWVVEWSGSAAKPRDPSNPTEAAQELNDIRRRVVVEVFEAGTGRELWHTVWLYDAANVKVTRVSEEIYRKTIDKEVEAVIEDIWARFWLG